MTLTFQLVFQVATRGDRESDDKLLKFDAAVLILVEDIEDIVCKLGGVAKREELLVDLLELGLVQLSTRAILDKALVPNRSEKKKEKKESIQMRAVSWRLSNWNDGCWKEKKCEMDGNPVL